MPNLFVDPESRPALMATIRSKNTKSELVVFSALRSRGLHFQRHYGRVLGKPDIARPRKKLAVFIDGDFWHGREIDRVRQRFETDSYWVTKLTRNMERDREQTSALEDAGWLVLRVWESDVKRVRTRAETIDKIEAFLRSRD